MESYHSDRRRSTAASAPVSSLKEPGQWSEVSPDQPCFACGKVDWCGILDDGSIVCCRRDPQGEAKVDINGNPYYVHHRDGREPAEPIRGPSRSSSRSPEPERADSDTLNRVYSALLQSMSLSETHRNNLIERKLPLEDIGINGYRSLPIRGRDEIVRKLNQEFDKQTLLGVPGIVLDGQGKLSLSGLRGLLIPIRDVRGRIVALKVRPDLKSSGGNFKVCKYLYMSSKSRGGPGPGSPVHVPLTVGKPSGTARITEGELKADVATALSGVPTLSAPGVTNWRPCIASLKALDAQVVRIAFDAEWRTNPQVARSLHECAGALEQAGFAVEIEHWDPADGKGIDDLLAEGKTPAVAKGDEKEALLREIAEVAGIAEAGEPPTEGHESGETTAVSDRPSPTPETQAQRLINIVLSDGSMLFHATDGKAFATIQVNGHRETHPVRGAVFKQWMIHSFYRERGGPPSSEALQAALSVLEAKATFEGPSGSIFIRTAEDAEANTNTWYVDLCNEEWQVVKITHDGWEVVPDPPVRFRRARGMLPLPVPERGGLIDDLRRFVNVGTGDAASPEPDDAWYLLIGWITAALRPSGPYPILNIQGEQGSAKSTLARVLRRLIDPHGSLLRSEPREVRDLMIAATLNCMVVLDNISTLTNWLSDALCRLATGGGFATRTLYENDEETYFDAMRPVILNGIGDFADRADLLDRCVILKLPSIPETERREEKPFWRDFEAAQPGILGALFDAMVGGLRALPGIKLDRHPRMADFARWGEAVGHALGWPEGAFLKAYEANRTTAAEVVIESSPIAPAIQDFMALEPCWEGTATRLLNRLSKIFGEKVTKAKGWPKTGRGMRAALDRVVPALRSQGIEVTFPGKTTGARKRLIKIESRPEKVGAGPSQSSQPSRGNRPDDGIIDPREVYVQHAIRDGRDGSRDGWDGSRDGRDDRNRQPSHPSDQPQSPESKEVIEIDRDGRDGWDGISSYLSGGKDGADRKMELCADIGVSPRKSDPEPGAPDQPADDEEETEWTF